MQLRALLLAGALLASPVVRATDPPPLPPIWGDAARYLFNDAHTALAARRAQTPLERLDEAFAAALLLNVQPRTGARLATAERELRRLIATDPDDEAGVAARFFLGRLLQFYLDPADLPAATTLYRQLHAAHPDHRLAQQAMVKLALLDLIPADGAVPDPAALEHYGRHAFAFSEPTARRDLHLLVGRAWLYHRDRLDLPPGAAQRAALAHHTAALDLGNLGLRNRAEILVATGNLAAELGETDTARAAYADFIAHYRRDIRVGTIRQRLAALPAP